MDCNNLNGVLILSDNQQQKVTQKVMLNDVVVMRLLLIFLLLIYHSFAPFTGSWHPVSDFGIDLYSIIGRASYSFFVEAFVFISGILLGFKHFRPGIDFIKNKVRRILLPSIIFSIIYFICFVQWTGYLDFFIGLISGYGHLWFLPMLFWCFVIISVVVKSGVSPKIIIPLAFLTAFFINRNLPFQVGQAFYFFPFLYLGYIMGSYQIQYKYAIKPFYIILSGLMFITGSLYYSKYQSVIGGGKLFVSLTGLLFCYMLILKFFPKEIIIAKWTVALSGYCYGVYIFQQFILVYFYYYLHAAEYVNILWLPWIAFAITLILSVLGTYLILKTRVGRFLLG